MCIALFSTAHPDYALIALDNRDEYILRPTSRPHWWTHPTTGEQILSSRDLYRAERGTWLGLSKTGNLAVLTNYRESHLDDVDTNICGLRSRGKVVNAWLGGLADKGIVDGVHELVANDGVKGVGGFSITCGKLRKNGEGTAIVSNRAGGVDDVPIVGKTRGETWALSNTTFDNPIEWPKIKMGKKLLEETVARATESRQSEEEFIKDLFMLLDNDTLPQLAPEATMPEYLNQLRNSILIPPVGKETHEAQMEEARAKGPGNWEDEPEVVGEAPLGPFEKGMYGTQRQTVVLVDWEGNVTFVERALFDANGHVVKRGEGDVSVKFKVDGWEN